MPKFLRKISLAFLKWELYWTLLKIIILILLFDTVVVDYNCSAAAINLICRLWISGPGYVLSRSALEDIVAVANDTVFVPMEDVFVSGLCRVIANIQYTQIVGVAEDQTKMTRCNLATWVKNGHNIYPMATPGIWARVVGADARTDCMLKNGAISVSLLISLSCWTQHLRGLYKFSLHSSISTNI